MLKDSRLKIFLLGGTIAGLGGWLASSVGNPWSPRVSFRGIDSRFAGGLAEIVVANPTTNSLWFTGSHSQRPFTQTEYSEFWTWHARPSGGICGNDVGRHELPPGQNIIFRTGISPEWKGHTVRLGVGLSATKEYDEKTEMTCWSRGFSP